MNWRRARGEKAMRLPAIAVGVGLFLSVSHAWADLDDTPCSVENCTTKVTVFSEKGQYNEIYTCVYMGGDNKGSQTWQFTKYECFTNSNGESTCPDD